MHIHIHQVLYKRYFDDKHESLYWASEGCYWLAVAGLELLPPGIYKFTHPVHPGHPVRSKK